jgi:hypothetical protein
VRHPSRTWAMLVSVGRLYPKPFSIGLMHPGPVLDAESFCRKQLEVAFDGWGMFLRPEWFEDSLAELIAILWQLESRFDPERTDTFERYARWIIAARAVDVGPRRILGRNGSRTNDYVFDELEVTSRDRLVEDFGAWELSKAGDSGQDGGWLDSNRDRREARAHAILGL